MLSFFEIILWGTIATLNFLVPLLWRTFVFLMKALIKALAIIFSNDKKYCKEIDTNQGFTEGDTNYSPLPGESVVRGTQHSGLEYGKWG